MRNKNLILTFDDGPGNRLTPAILDLLLKHEVKASFFLLGKNIIGREPIVQRIAAEGHDICSHGYDHLNYWKVSPFRALNDIKRGWQIIDQALGRQGYKYPFRPPYGRLNLFCLVYLWIHKVPIYYWTVISNDTLPAEKRDSKRASVLAHIAGGAVVLVHDNDRINPNTESFVLSSVQAITAMADNGNIKLVTISKLLSHGR